MADALPAHLLAKVLADAAQRSGNGCILWHGLRTLIRCSATSSHLRAAAELAAQQLTLRLSDDQPPPPGSMLSAPGTHSWAARFVKLQLCLHGTGWLSTAPDLRPFLTRCDERPVIHAFLEGGAQGLGTLHCESILAASASVQELHCINHMPGQFPPRLEVLSISPGPNEALEAVLIRVQNCAHLRFIDLDLRETPAPVHVQLRAAELARLQLPSLRGLQLQLTLPHVLDFDASFLRPEHRPHAFALSLYVEDEAVDVDSESRMRILRSLPELMHACDQLNLWGTDLDLEAQLALRPLHLAAFDVSTFAVDVQHLPRATRLSVRFLASIAAPSGPARLAWSAITRCSGRVIVDLTSGCDELEIIGCNSGAAPDFEAGAGWQLTVHSNGTQIRGCPMLRETDKGVFVSANAAAAHWQPARNEVW